MNELHHDRPDDQTRTHVPLLPGAVIGSYRIIEKIGAGGMGEVYLAEDTRLKRNVALKFLPSHLVASEELKVRFFREAQAAARLNHPNIVTIHDVSEHEGRPYFVMEHVEGKSLRHFTHDKPLPLDMVVDYVMQICQGIGEAHRAGVVHRDIKAANVVIDSKGRARLLDFGLAAVTGDDKLTRTGSTLGTVAYMSPEQVSGREIDQRSDLFSLGIVLYELVTCRSPFQRDSEGATLRAIMQDPPEPLSRYKADVPTRLQQIVEKLLEKDRQLRYQTAEDVLADLKRLQYDSQQTGYRPPTQATPSRLKWWVGSAGVLAVAILGFLFFRGRQTAEPSGSDQMPMIAVLPFDNLGNAEDQYFAVGMTEEIISRLAGIDGLGVISSTSVMQYKASGKKLGEIGKALGVDYILEGSVRWARSGGQAKVRITPQLVRVKDDRHLWADNYERDLLEVFAVQEDIASKIVHQLDLKLLESDRPQAWARPTTNSRAYDFYLRGIAAVRRESWQMPDVLAAASYLDSAVRLDSSFTLAWAYRSRAYSLAAFLEPSQSYRRLAQESFEKALQLDPTSSYAHLAAGVFYNLTETDYDMALRELNLARSELHGDAELVMHIALVQLRQGKFDEADDNFRKATELDPLNAVLHGYRAGFYWIRRMYPEAEQSVDRAIALDSMRPDYYLMKSQHRVSRYGDWGKVREVTRKALGHLDTLEVVRALAGGPEQLYGGLPLDSLFPGMKLQLATSFEQFRQEDRAEKYPVTQTFYFVQQAEGFRAANDSLLHRVYLDSARTAARSRLDEEPDDAFIASQLGEILAELGECEQAIRLGTRGKELLSIDKCHW